MHVMIMYTQHRGSMHECSLYRQPKSSIHEYGGPWQQVSTSSSCKYSHYPCGLPLHNTNTWTPTLYFHVHFENPHTSEVEKISHILQINLFFCTHKWPYNISMCTCRMYSRRVRVNWQGCKQYKTTRYKDMYERTAYVQITVRQNKSRGVVGNEGSIRSLWVDIPSLTVWSM